MHTIIDPHIHFFDISKGEYKWLRHHNPPYWPDKSLINKTILPQNIVLSDKLIFAGAVHIEAGFDNNYPPNEIEWLEKDVYPTMANAQFKTIAFIDMFSSHLRFNQHLSDMLRKPSFVGVRYIFDENIREILQSSDFVRNLTTLVKHNLIFEFQLDFTRTTLVKSLAFLITNLPTLRCVINHAGLAPSPLMQEFTLWRKNLQYFANIKLCFIKCSGFEMASRAYTKEHVLAVLAQVHDVFGESRMMLASNFPLVLFSYDYAAYWEQIIACAKQCELPIKKVLYINAQNLYLFS